MDQLNNHYTFIDKGIHSVRKQGKEYVKAGNEFGTLSGHMLVIHIALYGFRYLGEEFGYLLALCLKEPGFTQSIVELEIFMTENNNVYKCITTSMDDYAL